MQNEKVIVIGAGAAGLYAAYSLKRRNVDFEILEASSRIGGRVKETRDFADFPIDLGAEWLHTEPEILQRMLLFGESFDHHRFETMTYAPKTYSTYSNGKTHKRNFLRFTYSEWKWKRDTWYGYLNTYILPKVQDKIQVKAVVNQVHYEPNEQGVTVKTTDGRTFRGDKVLVAVPLTVLQSGDIQFVPQLPKKKLKALAGGHMVPGLKCFIEFSERFYPDMQLPFAMAKTMVIEGEELFYDAAFQKDNQRNVLAFFCVGDPAKKFACMSTDKDIFTYLMKLLDKMYDGKASKHYVQHRIQTWFRVPHIRGAYSFYGVNSPGAAREPLASKVYFAGEYIAPDTDSYATVHGAMMSGQQAVNSMYK